MTKKEMLNKLYEVQGFVRRIASGDEGQDRPDEEYLEMIDQVIDDLDINSDKNGQLVSISDVDLGVEIHEDDEYKDTVGASDADFHECPVCGSDDITYGDSEEESVFIYRVHRCNKCETTWEERYDLVQVRIEKGETDA
jgi:formate dehydrogenase maturation protein FdhE